MERNSRHINLNSMSSCKVDNLNLKQKTSKKVMAHKFMVIRMALSGPKK